MFIKGITYNSLPVINYHIKAMNACMCTYNDTMGTAFTIALHMWPGV